MENWKVKDLNSATWVAKKIVENNNKILEIESVAEVQIKKLKEEIFKIQEWRENQQKEHKMKNEHLEHLIIDYFLEQKNQDSKFALKTPYGNIGKKTSQAKLIIKNELEFINKLDKEYIITKQTIDKVKLKKDLEKLENGNVINKTNGEVLDGVELETTSIYVFKQKKETIKDYDYEVIDLEIDVEFDKYKYDI